MEESLAPIALLIDSLRAADAAQRLESCRKLTVIAKALGEERTRRELIPFVNESVDDEDEVRPSPSASASCCTAPFRPAARCV
jgi:serine/threonine-protein phosphatase 2A regulatory subunit A